jgi:hypothetical protein
MLLSRRGSKARLAEGRRSILKEVRQVAGGDEAEEVKLKLKLTAKEPVEYGEGTNEGTFCQL